jgi:hypothetical protein
MDNSSPAPKINDIVLFEDFHSGVVHYGRVFDVTTRFGAVYVRPDHSQAPFSKLFEIVERVGENPSAALPPGRQVPNCGDSIVYEQFHGGPQLRGKAAAVLPLRNGDILIRPNRVNAPWCKLVEIVEDGQ